MRSSFSILSIVLFAAGMPLGICSGQSTDTSSDLAKPSSHADTASIASGEVLLDSAIAAFESQDSLSATVRLQVHLLGHHLFGPGKYLQKGAGENRQIRFEMAVRGRAGKFVYTQINDGRRLWLLEEMIDKKELRFLDLQRLREAGLLAVADISSPQLHAIGLGGLPGLMNNLQLMFRFGRAVRIEWNGMNVWAMRGVWRAEQLGQLISAPDQGDGNEYSKIVSQLPEWAPIEVGLLLDTETLFPYRFEFLRAVDSSSNKASLTPIAIMELLEVRFDAPIEEDNFDRPSNIRPKDITKEMLRHRKKQDAEHSRNAKATNLSGLPDEKLRSR